VAIVIANYETERRLFAELCNPGSPIRILLLHGESGVGKSTVLRSCMEVLPQHVLCVPIELRGTAVSVAEIFYRLGGHLGWGKLVAFRRQLAAIDGRPSTRVSKNLIVGFRNRINVTLYSLGLLERSERIAALTEALFEDLELSSRIVVLAFDTFDTAGTETSEWLAGPLLHRVARTESMRAVVAGQIVPDNNNIEWGGCCELRRLAGFTNPDHWFPIVQKLGKVLPHDPRLRWLAGVCDALKGNPAKIMQVIEGLPSRELTR
jgi:hypothetical protein